MGMAVGGDGAGGGRRRRRRASQMRVMNEINMTPFIDVVLVLLIIFMVAAPLMTNGIPIDLPETKAKALEGQVKPIFVSVDHAGKIYVGDTEVKLEELVARVQTLTKNGFDDKITFQGDKAAVWGPAMKVMAELQGAGFKKFAIQTAQQ
jgi:biopolymer transport protein TolR